MKHLHLRFSYRKHKEWHQTTHHQDLKFQSLTKAIVCLSRKTLVCTRFHLF